MRVLGFLWLVIFGAVSEKFIVESKNKIQNSTILFEFENKFAYLVNDDENVTGGMNYYKDKIISIEETESFGRFYPGLWGLDTIDGINDYNYNYNYTGKGVVAYVVDTGISNHNEFITNGVSRLVNGKTFVYGTTDYYDCNGHGTHVASILGGNICGVAKEVNLVSVRVFDCYGHGRYSELLSSLNWISKQRKGIINMSLAGTRYYLINEAVDNLVKKGFVVVSAAGNDRADACGYSPASAKTAMTVGCIDFNNTYCWNGNEGSCVNLFAPGNNVLGANLYGGYIKKSGTSMASPHVAGIAVQIKQRFPNIKPSLVKKIILNNAVKGSLFLRMSSSPNLGAKTLSI